jgi:DNA-binding MarR family transcriptional regulator
MGELGVGEEPPLARLLLMASRWFDLSSRAELQRRGWPALSGAQTLLFAHLREDSITPAELARRLGNSRQATHELIQGLVRLDLLQLTVDPRRRGGRLVCLTPRGRKLARDAYEILRDLETRLEPEHVTALRWHLQELGLTRTNIS